MKKIIRFIILGLLALVVAIGAGYGIISKMQQQEVALSERAMLNLEALARGENPCPERPPNFPLTPAEREQICRDLNGLWNAASIRVDGGVTPMTSDGSGAISRPPVTITGLRRNSSYMVVWDAFQCQRWDGECCEFQGTIVHEVRRL